MTVMASMTRLVVSGLSGGSGKTTVSLGLARAFARRGMRVAPFKKGPDYTDTAWLALAAGQKAANLDPFFFSAERIRAHFARCFFGADIGIIEGNRGFFDGRDLSGSSSTAEVAAALKAPVILVVDITKMTRTTAALVAGCLNFPGGERIAGVILNRSGGPRHAAIAKKAVEELAGVRVFGVLPRCDVSPIYERRAGLMAVGAHPGSEEALDALADFICEHVDVDAILATARSASKLPELDVSGPEATANDETTEETRPRIGIVRDEALWQYYGENLDALQDAGADLVFVSLFGASPWPELDGLYLGGGDIGPYAARLAQDAARKKEIAALIESGMPVYAEHSGYFYLGNTFTREGVSHEMAGVFPVSASITEKPARLGYMEAALTVDTPFYPAGCAFKGHEYHYADIAVYDAPGSSVTATLRKQAGGRRIEVADGLVYKAAFGTSMQIYAPAVPEWAAAFVREAQSFAARIR
ncbi:MAG: Cobyrinate a,c-diamide synthase [Desulfovibrio sp.]